MATGRDKKTHSKHCATQFSRSHSRGQSLVAHSGDCKRNSRIKDDTSPARRSAQTAPTDHQQTSGTSRQSRTQTHHHTPGQELRPTHPQENVNTNKVDPLVQTAWQWHLKEETGLETTTLAAQGLQRQDETMEFTNINMSRRRSNRLHGENPSANNEDEADSQMTETRTPFAGSKRAPATSLTPDRDRSTQVQKTHDLLPDEQMQENPAQVTPMGTAKTGASSDTALNLSDANFPPLSPPCQKNPGHANTESPMAEPPAVKHIQDCKDKTQANVNSMQDTSNKQAETNQHTHAHSKEAKSTMENPQQKKQDTNTDVSAKQVHTMHVKDNPSLKVDLTTHTHTALWQRVYPRPKKHWTV